MAKWRPVQGDISLSEGLSAATHHDALFYTWGILHADAHGVMKRAEAKGLVFPYRSTQGKVERAIDWLIEHEKLCEQEHRGRRYIHWCWWDLYQGEVIRKGRGAPLFEFFCPNENRAIQRDEARESAAQRPTIQDNTRQDSDKTKQDHPPVVPPVRGDRARPRKPPRHRPINPGATEKYKDLIRR